MVPIIEPFKPITDFEMTNILKSKTATLEDKNLILKTLNNIRGLMKKHNLPRWRLMPVIDFEFKTTFIYLD